MYHTLLQKSCRAFSNAKFSE